MQHVESTNVEIGTQRMTSSGDKVERKRGIAWGDRCFVALPVVLTHSQLWAPAFGCKHLSVAADVNHVLV
ncbi:hypothetical protein E2542_SST11441 [Spatholobus suberectus]|nr:hypothetical protein E2542_SST11441 [Spatholobus suberectus]